MLPYEMYLLPRLNRNKKDTPVKIVFTSPFIFKFSTSITFPHEDYFFMVQVQGVTKTIYITISVQE